MSTPSTTLASDPTAPASRLWPLLYMVTVVMIGIFMIRATANRMRESGFEDGVFWGYTAAQKGVSGNDALATAYRLRAAAERRVTQIKAAEKAAREGRP